MGDMKIACLEIVPLVKRFSLHKDVLWALQMTQKEVNARNRIVLTWAARSASQLKAFPPGHLHQELSGETCCFLGGGSMIRLQMGTRNRNTMSKQMAASRREIPFRP